MMMGLAMVRVSRFLDQNLFEQANKGFLTPGF
jgi:hypothetical protein